MHIYYFSYVILLRYLHDHINPILPSVPRKSQLAKNLILILEEIIKKSYERRDYESVDDKSLS